MKVNTREDEAHPWIADAGKSLYFSRKTTEGWKVFVSKRATAKGPQGWGEPKDAGLPVGFHHATLTPDGKTMYLQGPLEKDRWGLFWQITPKRLGELMSDPDPARAKRVTEAMLKMVKFDIAGLEAAANG